MHYLKYFVYVLGYLRYIEYSILFYSDYNSLWKFPFPDMIRDPNTFMAQLRHM